jgi:ABC-type lipoprotein export system ATPase subunit
VTAVLKISGVQKRYRSLRPLRVQDLSIAPGERVAVSGFDAGAAEVLVNLVTGASVPDEGEVVILGQRTSDIAGGDAWLASLDRFGIVSPRGVLLEAATIEQNLAMPLTLAIDPVPPDILPQVEALARDCGIPETCLRDITGEATPDIRARMHLARAIALAPRLLVLEHPAADLSEPARGAFAKDLVAATEPRALAALIITADEGFARMAAHRALRVELSTGAVKPIRKGWFG